MTVGRAQQIADRDRPVRRTRCRRPATAIERTTRGDASSGRRSSTGSSSATTPSATRASVAAAVIGLPIEAMRNSESSPIGGPPIVWSPSTVTSRSLPRPTTATSPGHLAGVDVAGEGIGEGGDGHGGSSVLAVRSMDGSDAAYSSDRRWGDRRDAVACTDAAGDVARAAGPHAPLRRHRPCRAPRRRLRRRHVRAHRHHPLGLRLALRRRQPRHRRGGARPELVHRRPRSASDRASTRRCWRASMRCPAWRRPPAGCAATPRSWAPTTRRSGPARRRRRARRGSTPPGSTRTSSPRARLHIAPDDVVLDRGSKAEGGLAIGDRVRIVLRSGQHDYRISGFVTIGGEDRALGATAALFRPDTAQQLLAEPGRYDGIAVEADPGIGADELRQRIRGVLDDPALEAVTGAELTAENRADVAERLQFFTASLLLFAGVSLFVATFIIYNTFSVVVAQRTPRAGPAAGGRGQPDPGARFGAAGGGDHRCAGVGGRGARRPRRGPGVEVAARRARLPACRRSATSSPPRTLVIAVLVGVVVTTVSAAIPGRRAATISPLAALRDPRGRAHDERGRAGDRRRGGPRRGRRARDARRPPGW